ARRKPEGRGLPGAEIFPICRAPEPNGRFARRLRDSRSHRWLERPEGRPRRLVSASRAVRQFFSAKGGPTVNPLAKRGLSRRFFLRGAGGALLAMPLLESLLPRTAGAQAVTPPKRLIVVKSFSTQ